MKTSPIIAFFLVLAVVTGQIQYSYTYCAMMKRSIDPSMQRRCFSHLASASVDGQRIISSLPDMLHVVSKRTTDSYEQQHLDAKIFLGNPRRSTAEDSELTTVLTVHHSDLEYPPPDIVIRTLNLRI